MIDRRSFLKGILVAVLSPTVAKAEIWLTQKILWGDGVHDDTIAFQAVIDGEDVLWADGTPVRNMDGLAHIRYKIFTLSNTIYINTNTGKEKVLVNDCVFLGPRNNTLFDCYGAVPAGVPVGSPAQSNGVNSDGA